MAGAAPTCFADTERQLYHRRQGGNGVSLKNLDFTTWSRLDDHKLKTLKWIDPLFYSFDTLKFQIISHFNS